MDMRSTLAEQTRTVLTASSRSYSADRDLAMPRGNARWFLGSKAGRTYEKR